MPVFFAPETLCRAVSATAPYVRSAICLSAEASPAILREARLVTVIEASAIDLPTMTDFYDFDRAFSVVNRVENAVVPLSYAIYIIPK